MTDAHAEFLQDPETHASHLEECAECRAIIERLDMPLSHQPIDLQSLPLAAWEGASHRSWGFVAACTITLAAIAYGLCEAAGLSPLHVVDADASLTPWRTLLALLSRAMKPWQIITAFAVANTLLFVLLRRPTRGIDA